MQEIWKPVLGFEEAYEASNLGSVRSIERQVWRKDKRRKGGGCYHTLKGKQLKPAIGFSKTCRYPMVTMSHTLRGKSLKRTFYLVHRIVWEAFNGLIPYGYEIDHIDDNNVNNQLINLRCLSKEEHKKKTYSKKIGREWITAGKMSSRAIHEKFEIIRKESYDAGYDQALYDSGLRSRPLDSGEIL